MHNSFGSCLEAQGSVWVHLQTAWEGTHVSLPASERGPYPPAFFTWWRKSSLHSFPLGSNVEWAFPTVNLGSELWKLSSHPYLSLPTFEMTVSPKQDAVGSLLPGLSLWGFGSGYFVSSNLSMSVSAPPYWSQLPWQGGRPGLDLWVGKIPWRREWQATHSYSSLEDPMDRGAWGLQSMGLQRVGTTEHLTLSLSLHFHSEVTSYQWGFSLHMLVSRAVPMCSEPVGPQWLSSQKTPESWRLSVRLLFMGMFSMWLAHAE